MSEFLSFFLELPLVQEISGSLSWTFLFLVVVETLSVAVFVFDPLVTGTICVEWILPALFAFSTNSFVVTLGSTLVSSDSSSLSSESGSGGSSPSLASVEKILFYRFHSQRIICNIRNTILNLFSHYVVIFSSEQKLLSLSL